MAKEGFFKKAGRFIADCFKPFLIALGCALFIYIVIAC